MPRVSSKTLLLLAFLLLCFCFVPTAGRNLRAAEVVVVVVSSKGGDEHENVVPGKQVPKKGPSYDDGLLDMDYTPARRKPPIHN